MDAFAEDVRRSIEALNGVSEEFHKEAMSAYAQNLELSAAFARVQDLEAQKRRILEVERQRREREEAARREREEAERKGTGKRHGKETTARDCYRRIQRSGKTDLVAERDGI